MCFSDWCLQTSKANNYKCYKYDDNTPLCGDLCNTEICVSNRKICKTTSQFHNPTPAIRDWSYIRTLMDIPVASLQEASTNLRTLVPDDLLWWWDALILFSEMSFEQ